MKNLVFAIFLLAIPLKKTFAYTPKEGNVSAILGPFTQRTNFDNPGRGPNTPYLGGVGLIAIGDINDYSSLELAGFYMNKLFVREQGGKYLAEKTQVLHITMGYRRWLSSIFSTSLAFYSAYPMGDYDTIQNDFPSANSLDTSARDATEYGLDFALQAELWSSGLWSVTTDVRYSRSITAKAGERSDHYGGMIGVCYFIQGKNSK